MERKGPLLLSPASGLVRKDREFNPGWLRKVQFPKLASQRQRTKRHDSTQSSHQHPGLSTHGEHVDHSCDCEDFHVIGTIALHRLDEHGPCPAAPGLHNTMAGQPPCESRQGYHPGSPGHLSVKRVNMAMHDDVNALTPGWNPMSQSHVHTSHF